ncbi:MAG: hypothetical protein AAF491_09635 [Verrucomicrobiota bacterium]
MAYFDQFPALNSIIDEALRERITATPMTGWVLLVLFAIVVFLLGRLSRRPAAVVQESMDEGEREALLWRHEKLVLFERQESERRAREVGRLDDILAGVDFSLRVALATLVAEARETRQTVGTDCSRLELVKSQLERFLERGAERPEALRACVEMAESQRRNLVEFREEMRPISQSLVALEESFTVENETRSEVRERIKEQLQEVEGLLEESSGEWQVLTDETDRRIRETLEAGGEKAYRPICEILLIDGAVTDSLRHAKGGGLLGSVRKVIELLEEEGAAQEVKHSQRELTPSTEFAPASESSRSLINGHHGVEVGGEKKELPPESGTLVVFRSNDVSLWGSNVYTGANRRARALKQVPAWAEWISIRRIDTGEAISIAIQNFSFSSAELAGAIGFNGSGELFYGAQHLGMFSDTCPNMVETKFTYGGWGFGHRVGDLEETGDSPQSSGWAGEEISPDTVFEIALHAELPMQNDGDQVLKAAELSASTS